MSNQQEKQELKKVYDDQDQELSTNGSYINNVIQQGDVENEEDWQALEKAEASNISLLAEYWTPEGHGETKDAFYLGVKLQEFPDFNDHNLTNLVATALFAVQEDGIKKVICNASTRLVSAVKSFKPMTAMRVTYLGKKKNKSNNMSSDTWAINPLKLR